MAVYRLAHNASPEAAEAAAEGFAIADLKRQLSRCNQKISILEHKLTIAENTIRRDQAQSAARYAGARNRREAEHQYRKTLFFGGIAIGITISGLVITAVMLTAWL